MDNLSNPKVTFQSEKQNLNKAGRMQEKDTTSLPTSRDGVVKVTVKL